MITIVEPEVKLIAQTAVNFSETEPIMMYHGSSHTDHLMTFAGRLCYKSFHRPNPVTYDDEDYLKRTVLEQLHGSIAEHATASFYLTGVSRAFLAEITRHRHLSFSVVSQRFVDESDAAFVMPPAIRDGVPGVYSEDVRAEWENDMESALNSYRSLSERLINDGLPRKQAREAARSILPNATETRMVVSGNLRAWMDVIERRTDPAADAEIQEVMKMVNNKLVTVSPSLFEEMEI